MSDRSIRDGERASRSTGAPDDEERLANQLLRAGRLDELGTHLEQAISARRRAGEVCVRLEAPAGRSADEIVRSLAEGTAPGGDFGEDLPGEKVPDALERLLCTSAGYDGEVMDRGEAAALTRRLLGLLGPIAGARLNRGPRWETISPGNVRLQGRELEAGMIVGGEHLVALVWFADGDAECRAEGQPCRREQLGVREFNFGQPWRTPGIQDVDYVTEIPRRLVESYLSLVLAELVRDAQENPDDDGTLEGVLRAAGWPDANEILGDPRLSTPTFELFDFNLMLAWAGWSPREGVAYFANSIDTIEVLYDRVIFRGKARRAEPPAPGVLFAYQDF